jgi:hypothetical protein
VTWTPCSCGLPRCLCCRLDFVKFYIWSLNAQTSRRSFSVRAELSRSNLRNLRSSQAQHRQPRILKICTYLWHQEMRPQCPQTGDFLRDCSGDGFSKSSIDVMWSSEMHRAATRKSSDKKGWVNPRSLWTPSVWRVSHGINGSNFYHLSSSSGFVTVNKQDVALCPSPTVLRH